MRTTKYWRAHGNLGDVPQAREWILQTVVDQSEVIRDAAVLLADECLANAVQHGGGAFEMIVQRGPDTLRVEVLDESPELPVSRSPDSDSERGWGLTIVDRLASRWGARGLNHG